jgi:hypothetical protein
MNLDQELAALRTARGHLRDAVFGGLIDDRA